MKEASLALGASRWQTMIRVIIPYAKSGIAAAIILGIGRAVGETMAVLMVSGNAAVIPHTFLQPVRTIPATIAAELGEAPAGGLHYKALFALGIILFMITFGINMTVDCSRQNPPKKPDDNDNKKKYIAIYCIFCIQHHKLYGGCRVISNPGLYCCAGIGVINWTFLTSMPKNGMTAGEFFLPLWGLFALSSEVCYLLSLLGYCQVFTSMNI